MTKTIILSFLLLFTCIITTAQDSKSKDSDAENGTTGDTNMLKYNPSVVDVTDNIFMLKGMGGNIAVHHGIDGVLMIDTQFENASDFIKNIIQRKTEKSVEFVVNTHLHGDHTGGNKNFSRKGATIIAHKNVRSLLLEKLSMERRAEAEKKLSKELETIQNSKNEEKAEQLKDAYGQKIEALVESVEIDYEALPAISFENDLLFHYNDEDIKLIYLPDAHTESDIAVFFPKSNVLHTGDAFVNNMYPFIDIKNNGSYKGYLRGLKTIERLCNKDTKIIPGHGEIASVADVKVLALLLESYYTKVKNAYLMDKTEDEVAARRDFTKVYDDRGFGDGFINTEKLLRALYKEAVKNEGAYKRENDHRKMKIEKLENKNDN